MQKQLIAATFCSILLAGAALAADTSGRLYGKITTKDGDTYEGLIRWDKNEASWVDVLDGTKVGEEVSTARSKRAHRKSTKIEFFGVQIGDSEDDGDNLESQCGIRMGNIKTIVPEGDDGARLTLQSGQTLHMTGSSTDIGSEVRQIIIEDKHEGETELAWEDLDKVEFIPARADLESSTGDRLFGTVTTRRGDLFTGYVAWDADEVFGSDILDGEVKDRPRKIHFDKIAAIERYSSSGASVTLKSGENLVLRGSNDVDDDNRGIVVSDPAFGQVTIPWDQFGRVEFKPAPRAVSYNQFDGGRPLRGTVYTEEGDEYTGTIQWDNDEQYTWEMLNGEYHDVTFEIEMGFIRSIEKQSSTTSLVTIADGRTFRLRGSNDVDESNRGVFVTASGGKTVEVDWADFVKVEFSAK